MPRITVEKYVAGTLESSFDVPCCLLRLGARWLPRAAVAALKDRGLDIEAIRDAHRSGRPYASSIEVAERGVKKKVVLLVY